MHRKTWGPFSGGQLTTIVCVIAAAFLVPVGASAAVKFTNVAITDATGAHRAKIDAGGKLAVGDGAGPLTVDGTVTATNALPAKPITIQATDLVQSSTTLYGPTTKPFGVSSLTVANLCAAKQLVVLYSTTSGASYELQSLIVPANDTIALSFPTPLVITPASGNTASLIVLEYTSINCVSVSGVGVQS